MQIQTQHGEMDARVFIECGERAIGVMLEQHGQLIGCLRIDDRYVNDALRTARDWLPPFQLRWGEKSKLMSAVREEHAALRRIRVEGVSPSVGWLGSPAMRALPQGNFCALA